LTVIELTLKKRHTKDDLIDVSAVFGRI